MTKTIGVTLLLLISICFASNHIAARVAFDHGANVTTAVAVRSGGTALAVLALLAIHRVPLALPAPLRWRALAVGVVLAVQSYCLYSAVARIPVALALLAFNTFPMILSLMSWASGAERPSRRLLLAMPLALAGLALALDVGGWSTGRGVGAGARWAEIGAGVGWALGAAASFAAVLFLTTRWLPGVDGRVRSFYAMSVTAALLVAAGALAQDFALPRDGTGWLGLALLTAFYGVAITSLFVVLPRLGAVNNAMVLNFEPVAALCLGWAILGQSLAALQLVGAGIVLGAILLLHLGRR